MTDSAELLESSGKWRSRDVKYWGGRWRRLSELIPTFRIEDFRARPDAPANPHMQAVVRQPLNITEQPIPVGVVSNSYALVQHHVVIERCLAAMRKVGVDPAELSCELGLTPLGEWMSFKVYFPDSYAYTARDGKKLALRLECSNSVDGSSRLVILLSWFRLICSNGLVIRETKAELRDTHDEHLDLDAIEQIIIHGMAVVSNDRERMERLASKVVSHQSIKSWADGPLAALWGKKAACRTFHICVSGQDVEITDPFAKGDATDKPVVPIRDVPGAARPARTAYDVAQALSWVATQRLNTEERLLWQSSISELVGQLEAS